MELAQVGAPMRLEPPQDAPSSAPLVPAPLAPVPQQMLPQATPTLPNTASQPPSAPVVESGSSAVTVNRLQAVDPDSAGVLSSDKGGLGVAMWKGVSRRLVDRLVPEIPARSSSTVSQDLSRRLLLSTATAPAYTDDGPRQSLMAARIERLGAMGDLLAVERLLQVAADREGDATLARAQVDSLLLRNDNAGACAMVRTVVRGSDTPFWQRGLIFCQALAGEHEKAALGVKLLAERAEEAASPVFSKLVRALAGDAGAVVDSMPAPSPLDLAMMRAARQPLPADVVYSPSPAILAAVALSPNASLDVRLVAAERAEAFGALPVESVALIFISVSFATDDLANAVSRAGEIGGARGRALLYQAARAQGSAKARARVLQAAYRQAVEGGQYGTMVRLTASFLENMDPDADLVWFAADAVRAFLFLGDDGGAERWMKEVETAAAGNPAVAKVLARLWPLAELLDMDKARSWNEATMAAWRDEMVKDDPVRADIRATILYTLFDALGEAVADDAWPPLVTAPFLASQVMPTTPFWQALRSAAAADRIGETVLLVLVALGDGGVGQAHPMVISLAVSSLRQVGLESEARHLALEAAIAAGV